jgi:hypothetical protein
LREIRRNRRGRTVDRNEGDAGAGQTDVRAADELRVRFGIGRKIGDGVDAAAERQKSDSQRNDSAATPWAVRPSPNIPPKPDAGKSTLIRLKKMRQHETFNAYLTGHSYL